jgi:hypothetical protein
MTWDWFSPAVSGFVGVAGLYFGWLAGKQSRDQAERLARQNSEDARLMAEQRDSHIRLLEEDRRRHEQRMVEEERRQQRLAEAYLEIMTTMIRTGESLVRESGSATMATVPEHLVRASALADTFASDHVLDLFQRWRDTVEKFLVADARLAANADADASGGRTAVDLRHHWGRQVRDLRLREGDARRALADAVAAELRARRPPPGSQP